MTEEFQEFTSKYDLAEQQERFTQNRRRHERALRRIQAISITLGVTVVMSGFVGVSYIIWQGTKGPSAGEQIEEKLREDCIAAKGSWVFLSVDDGPRGTCLFGAPDPRRNP